MCLLPDLACVLLQQSGSHQPLHLSKHRFSHLSLAGEGGCEQRAALRVSQLSLHPPSRQQAEGSRGLAQAQHGLIPWCMAGTHCWQPLPLILVCSPQPQHCQGQRMPQLGMSELDEIFGLLPGGSGVSEMLLEQAKASSLFHLLSQWRFATEHWEEDLLSQPLWRGRYRVDRKSVV